MPGCYTEEEPLDPIDFVHLFDSRVPISRRHPDSRIVALPLIVYP
jgi:hypothetical protein